MSQDRVLPLEGVHNFRDYGGYAVPGGGRIKSGLLWRSAQHGGATDADLAAIDALNLRHVFDFRGTSEREANPCRRGPGFAAEVIFHEGETANLAPHIEAAGGTLDETAAFEAMRQIYHNLPNRKPLHLLMRRYFEALARGEGASLVHCVAGKDRTGMAVAMVHHALGVHPDDAMADFLLTNSAGNLDRRIAAGGEAIRARNPGITDETIRVLMGVDARYLEAARQALADTYGSTDAFLEQEIGVDDRMRAALREHLVE